MIKCSFCRRALLSATRRRVPVTLQLDSTLLLQWDTWEDRRTLPGAAVCHFHLFLRRALSHKDPIVVLRS